MAYLAPARLRAAVAVVAAVALIATVGAYFWVTDFGDPRLTPYVSAGVEYPVVFTSRSGPASFRAAPGRGEGFAAPGQSQWQEREGRLRVLTTGGRVRELTWGKPLAVGGTLVDVMSPSVSPDARTVAFAGRRAGERFRIYSVPVAGGPVEQLTGLPDDSGCSALPPLRFAADGTRLPDTERRRLDYDDIDPTLLPDGTLFFASSRTPDLGGRDRRATQLWRKEPGKPPAQHTATRASDRWPFLTTGREVLFTLWSRQDEVVAADGTGLVRHDPPAPGLTAPADRWVAVTVTASSESFGQAVKVAVPTWRVRPLFTSDLAYMTTQPGSPTPFTPANEHPETARLRVAKSKYGQVASAPSALAAGDVYPTLAEPPVVYAPAATADGRAWSLATPSPLPPVGGASRVLVAAAPLTPEGTPDLPGYGLASVPLDGWPADPAAAGEVRTLFDDPDLIDAEPVAAYPRPVAEGRLNFPQSWDPDLVKAFRVLAGPYSGPAGEVEARQLTDPVTGQFPGQRADGPDAGPVVPNFPQGSIRRVDFYASQRDRFDDPDRPVVRGELVKLLEAPTAPRDHDSLKVILPVGPPTLLVGLGADGKIVSATGAADAAGHRGKFYAFAGDHVSGTRPGGYHFCTGCHTGHTFGQISPERLK
jgi:hypothetical protein